MQLCSFAESWSNYRVVIWQKKKYSIFVFCKALRLRCRQIRKLVKSLSFNLFWRIFKKRLEWTWFKRKLKLWWVTFIAFFEISTYINEFVRFLKFTIFFSSCLNRWSQKVPSRTTTPSLFLDPGAGENAIAWKNTVGLWSQEIPRKFLNILSILFRRLFWPTVWEKK